MTHPNVQYFSQQSWKTITVHSVHNVIYAFMYKLYIVHIKDLSRFLFLCSGTIRNGLLKTIYGLGYCKYIYIQYIPFYPPGSSCQSPPYILIIPKQKFKKGKEKNKWGYRHYKKRNFLLFFVNRIKYCTRIVWLLSKCNQIAWVFKYF